MQLANCATLHGSILNCNEGLPRAATVTPRKKKKSGAFGWWLVVVMGVDGMGWGKGC